MMGGKTPAYLRVRDQLQGKDWEIIGFTADTFVLRIERENVEFHRTRGVVKDRRKL